MILVIDMNAKKNSIAYFEFVEPVLKVLKKMKVDFEVVHFSEVNYEVAEKYDKIILTGTPLKDDEFLKHPEKFAWMEKIDASILGICAGMEIIAKAFGCSIGNEKEIGMVKVRVFEKSDIVKVDEFDAYELHRFSIIPNENFIVLARSEKCVQIIKHRKKPFFGVQFHPEVRNEWLIKNFVEL